MVLERPGEGFLAVPNLAVKNAANSTPEWIAGLGETVEEALDDALTRFFREIESHSRGRALTDDDFEWSDPEDF
jgi:hypothetical protein